MTHVDSGQPFPIPSQVPAAEPRIGYLAAYSFVFDSPDWLMNLLWGALAQLSAQVIPIVGPLAFLGYVFEIIEGLHREPKRVYPSFDINRFVDYLGRGAWPFLVYLVVALVISPVAAVVLFGGVVGLVVGAQSLSRAGDDTAAVLVGALGGSLLVLVMMLLSYVFVLLVRPMALRAGLAQSFGEGFRMGWVLDFVRRTWVEMTLVFLFFMITAPLIAVAGLALLCIGVFPASAWITLADGYFSYQLYELYLSRGGEPIPLKPRPQPLRPPQPI